MKSFLSLEFTFPEALPEPFRQDDVRYPESLVEHFLQAYTRPGDTVLDPFAGYGTTLIVAERMGRNPYGVELDEARVKYVRRVLARPEHLILGDARRLAHLELPEMDFSITSPPYMNVGDREDPFTAYREKGTGYAAYLQELRRIYAQLRQRMKPGGTVVLEVANLKLDGQVTTLAWDVAEEVSRVLHFEGEVIVCWDRSGYGYEHSYCLVYSVI